MPRSPLNRGLPSQSAFIVTNPGTSSSLLFNECIGLIASIFFVGSVGGLAPPYDYCSTSARSRFRSGRAYCSNWIDTHRAAGRKVACEQRHRRKRYHNHDDRQRIVGSHSVEQRGNEVREAERECQP